MSLPSISEDKNIEWVRENTLTAPLDRNPEVKWKGDRAPCLTNEELDNALNVLNRPEFVQKFPAVERKYADPTLSLQKIGLISFVPSKTAKPDADGIYGFIKLRGNYATEEEANERAEEIIREVDSYHPIYHAYVGRPFPVTLSSNFSKTVNRVDIKRSMESSISSRVKELREKDQKDIEEVQSKEKRLLEDVAKEKEDPDDHYTVLRVKKAQLSWTYQENTKKLQDIKEIIKKTSAEIEEMEKDNPQFRDTYFNKYMEARKAAGMDDKTVQENFMKFMVEDIDLGFQ